MLGAIALVNALLTDYWNHLMNGRQHKEVQNKLSQIVNRIDTSSARLEGVAWGLGDAFEIGSQRLISSADTMANRYANRLYSHILNSIDEAIQPTNHYLSRIEGGIAWNNRILEKRESVNERRQRIIGFIAENTGRFDGLKDYNSISRLYKLEMIEHFYDASYPDLFQGMFDFRLYPVIVGGPKLLSQWTNEYIALCDSAVRTLRSRHGVIPVNYDIDRELHMCKSADDLTNYGNYRFDNVVTYEELKDSFEWQLRRAIMLRDINRFWNPEELVPNNAATVDSLKRDKIDKSPISSKSP